MSDERALLARVIALVDDIELGMKSKVRIGQDPGPGKLFIQIEVIRVDVITGIEGEGRSGKYYPSVWATDNEIVQAIFGLYKGYWEHEARENFKWRKRRVFGPHISVEALWDAAPRVDVRSQRHEEDKPIDPLAVKSAELAREFEQEIEKRERIRRSNPWTWPLITLGALIVLVVGGTIWALVAS